MAGSRLGFETDVVQLHQVLAVKHGAAGVTVTGDDGGLLRPWWTGLSTPYWYEPRHPITTTGSRPGWTHAACGS